MDAVMSELPLALFTTLAPMGAGAFVLLAVAFATAKFSDEQLRRIDRMTAIPLVAVLVGFVCSFFHLASPMNAFHAFAGLGSSPLSNEIAVGVLFVVVAVVYWALAMAGKLSGGARTGFAVVVAVVAVVFAVFTGLAYDMNTIASWSTPLSPVQTVGYLLIGGTALGAMVLGLAGALGEACSGSFKTCSMVIAVVGAVAAVGGLAGQVMGVSGMQNALQSGAELVGAATPFVVVAVVCLVAAAVLAVLSLRGMSPCALAGAATACALVGIFVGRLAFYAVQLSVGLYIAG